jgi:hypothetical protein
MRKVRLQDGMARPGKAGTAGNRRGSFMSDENEHPADLVFWIRNGCCIPYKARVPADTEVSIGRTDSERAMGFTVTRGDTTMDFVLNKDQVAELAAYLELQLARLLPPRGRKPEQISFAASVKQHAAQVNKEE